ncbi:MAG: hypothetical protein JWP37_437, partial [Mucilaginibacter sp.]|nr:hypothetical protein [Mucilaginibacter sp.]
MRRLVHWFGYAVVITLLCGIIYIVAQQNFRQAANDPQVQLAQEAANAINNGADPKTLAAAYAPIE